MLDSDTKSNTRHMQHSHPTAITTPHDTVRKNYLSSSSPGFAAIGPPNSHQVSECGNDRPSLGTSAVVQSPGQLSFSVPQLLTPHGIRPVNQDTTSNLSWRWISIKLSGLLKERRAFRRQLLSAHASPPAAWPPTEPVAETSPKNNA